MHDPLSAEFPDKRLLNQKGLAFDFRAGDAKRRRIGMISVKNRDWDARPRRDVSAQSEFVPNVSPVAIEIVMDRGI